MSSSANEQDSRTWIVVSTCDSYGDAWQPFFDLMARYWPDCPYSVAVVTESHRLRESATSGIQNLRWIHLNHDHGWATNLRIALDQIGAESIVYLQEDYFLQRRVDTNRLRQTIQLARKEKAAYVRLPGRPEPTGTVSRKLRLGLLKPGTKFRCSLQSAWWDVAVLRQLLVEGETGWEMEIAGSRRSDRLERPFWAAEPQAPLLDYYFHTAILKGKWLPGALALCRREGIFVDTSRRETHPAWLIPWREFRNSPAMKSVRRLWPRGSRKAAS